MSKALLKVLFSDLIRIITFPLRLMPVKKNRILFTGLTGGNVYDYSCNPKYIYEYLRDNHKDQYEFVWMVSDPLRYGFLKEEGVKLYKHFAVSSFPVLLTSKIVVTNGSYAPWFPFRRSQYVINTWHGGGAYKKVENGRPDADYSTRRRAKLTADNIDLFLASCRVQEEQMIKTTYNYKGEVLRAGTPRNDKLVTGDTDLMAEKVRAAFNIPKDGRIVLYAPTYRNMKTGVILDSDLILKRLEENGDKWYFLSRYHRYHTGESNVKVIGKRVIVAEDYPDMQELLASADLLITDYSSCVWDYSFLNRPCVLYVPDKEEYNINTGFYVGMERWPFPETFTIEELADKAALLLEDKERNLPYWRGLKGHIDELGSYESGKACSIVAKRIALVTSESDPLIRRLVKGMVFKVLYPLVYRLAAIRPVKTNKVIFVENHEDYLTDNFVNIYDRLSDIRSTDGKPFERKIHYLKVASSGWGAIIRRSLHLIWDMGNAGYVFLDESNSLFGAFRLKEKTKLIQLWHACGAFKKWGFSVADKSFGDDKSTLMRYSGHRNYSLVPVSGSEVIWAYEEAFGLSHKRGIVKPLGVSRTDIYYDENRRKEAYEKLDILSLKLNGRKIVSYLPTFRGSIAKAKGPKEFEPLFLKSFGDEMVFLIKNHPFVKEPFDIPENCRDFCMEIHDELSIEDMIMVSDICITDYSSVVFEYSLMNKPIIFYAFDVDSYDLERGFYYKYMDFVPGPVAFDMEKLCEIIENIDDFDHERLRSFKERFMSGCDGKATERILKEIGIL